MGKKKLFNDDDLVVNPTARVPVCLCLDVSGSMDGEKINELNDGVKMFFDSLRKDDTAKYAVEICIVTFGGNDADCLLDFASLDKQTEPTLNAQGQTPMGEAVTMALGKLESRKNEYKQKGVDYHQPWLVLMSDGEPNGNPTIQAEAIQRCSELVNNKKLVVFAIGIGQEADMNVLANFSPKRNPLRLKGLNFSQFFEWLSASAAAVTASMPGEKVQLDLQGVKEWGEL